MKKLWMLINRMDIKKSAKNGLYLFSLILISIAAGAFIWLLFGRHFLEGNVWLLCFMGYPAAFIGLFGGILYIYNHDFS